MRALFVLMLSLTLQFVLPRGPQVINVGHPGQNSADLDARFDEALRSAKPNYVIIMTGANDALNDKKLLSPEQTRIHLRSMIERAQDSKAIVLLVTTHNPDMGRLLQRHRLQDYGSHPPLARLAAVNTVVANLATQLGVALVDFHAVLASQGGADTDLSTDGVHLTARGYGMLAAAVLLKLPKEISAKDIVLCFGDSLTYGQGVRAANGAETPLTYPSQLRAMLQH